MLIEAFVSKLPIEALDKGVLNRFSRLNKPEFDFVFKSPEIKGLADKLRPVVHRYHFRQPASQGDTIKHSAYSLSGERVVCLQNRTFSAEVIDNGQYSKTAAAEKVVGNKIHGPVLIDPFRTIEDNPEMACSFLAPL